MNDIAERIEKKIERIPFSACWYWAGRSDSYGPKMDYKRKQCMVRRLSYEAFVEALPQHACVSNSCGESLCVNPAHLVLTNHGKKAKLIHEKLKNYLVAENGCWHWQGYKLNSGYGAIKQDKKILLAHRESYRLHKGEIPEGMCVCHACDNRGCINPGHLWLGTTQDNTMDRQEKCRQAKGVRVHNSKLTENDVRAIRESAKKVMAKDLACAYKIDVTGVYKILRRESWGHVV